MTRPRTAPQLETQGRFGGASGYAAQVKADPGLVERYRRRGKPRGLNYRHMAMRDYFNPPVISRLELNDYTAAGGGEILVYAMDDFEVVSVTLTLRDAQGAVVGSGEATLDPVAWRFHIPPATAERAPSVIEAVAKDRPGNCTSKSFALPVASNSPAAEMES